MSTYSIKKERADYPTCARFQDINLIEKLDQGPGRTVWLGHQELPGGATRKVVVKAIDLDPTQAQSDNFLAEVGQYSRLSHQGIPRLFSSSTSFGKGYLILEYFEGKTISDLIVDRVCHTRHLREEEIVAIGRQLISIVNYLHQVAQCSHGDIRAQNIIIRPDGNIGLFDFGLSRPVLESSPGSSSTSADIAEVGWLLCELALLEILITSNEEAENIIDRIREKRPELSVKFLAALGSLLKHEVSAYWNATEEMPIEQTNLIQLFGGSSNGRTLKSVRNRQKRVIQLGIVSLVAATVVALLASQKFERKSPANDFLPIPFGRATCIEAAYNLAFMSGVLLGESVSGIQVPREYNRKALTNSFLKMGLNLEDGGFKRMEALCAQSYPELTKWETWTLKTMALARAKFNDRDVSIHEQELTKHLKINSFESDYAEITDHFRLFLNYAPGVNKLQERGDGTPAWLRVELPANSPDQALLTAVLQTGDREYAFQLTNADTTTFEIEIRTPEKENPAIFRYERDRDARLRITRITKNG